MNRIKEERPKVGSRVRKDTRRKHSWNRMMVKRPSMKRRLEKSGVLLE